MEIKFTLKDFEGNTKDFILKKPQAIKDIIYTVLTGDEVIYVTYKDDEQEIYDSYDGDRMYSGLDKVRVITLEELQKLNHE